MHAVALALAAGGCPVQQLNRGDLLLIAVLWLLSRSRVQTVQAATACEEGRYVAYSSIAAAFGNSANPMRILADRI